MADTSLRTVKRRIPERIKQIRGDRSQRQFARDLGVFQQNINRYEKDTVPHFNFLHTLARVESINLNWLVFGKGKMRS